ncbi:T9SS type A sorting domain-containing protein [candidate division KSB1 bacterium]|nr:T9SS type A sorting domain-containing protein [candidate division KSB1 bacterium]
MNTTNIHKIVAVLSTLLLIVFLPLYLSAQVLIDIENPSFELPGDAKHTNFDDVPGWSTDSTCTDSGVEESDSATDGAWAGFMMSGDPSVWQLTDHVIAAGEFIELHVDVWVTWIAEGVTIGLYYDNAGERVELNSTEIAVTSDMTGYSVGFYADDTPAAIGNTVGIELQNSTASASTWVGMDNVRLYNMIALDIVMVEKVDAPVVIDGVIDEVWDNILGNIVRNVVVNTIDDPLDNEGRWKALYDNDYLYLAFTVTDDELNDDSDGVNEHDDGLDIVLDTDNEDETSPVPEDMDDFVLTAEYSSTGDCAVSGEKWSFATLDVEGIEAKCMDTSEGYDMEVAIPLENLDLYGDELIGFGIRINDDDDGDDRDSQIAWFMTDAGNWNNPSALADLEFVVPTGVKESPAIARGFQLNQNYPNPFNPRTTIDYELNISGMVTVEIYNVLGQSVKILVNQHLEAGFYQTNWDATDKFGQKVNSGVYFCKLTTPNKFSLVKKMVLLK